MPNWKKIIVSGSDASLSSLHIDGNLTASAAFLTSASIGHLETIYETASVIYSSGSTKFGDTLDDTHEITGSLLVSGNAQFIDSIQINDNNTILSQKNSDGQLKINTQHGYLEIGPNNATFAHFYTDISKFYFNKQVVVDSGLIGSYDDNLQLSAPYNTVRLTINKDTGNALFTNSVTASSFTGSFIGELDGTASIADLATTASHALNVPDTASHALTAVTASHTAGTASIANLATTASIADLATTASQADNATTASHIVTASFADNATTSSFAITASYALNATAGGGGGGVGATNAQTISADLHVSQSENQLLIAPLEIDDGTVVTVESDAILYIEDFIPPTLVDSASVAINAINATNADTASYVSKRQLVSIESSDITASLYTTHLITSPLSMSAPTSPTEGDWFKISQRVPSGSNFTSSLLFGNGSQIMSASTELELDVEDQGLEFIYADATQGWVIIGN